MWFLLAYTIAKYGMSMCVLGMAEEFKGEIAVNALWPKTGMYFLKILILDSHLLSLRLLRCILGLQGGVGASRSSKVTSVFWGTS